MNYLKKLLTSLLDDHANATLRPQEIHKFVVTVSGIKSIALSISFTLDGRAVDSVEGLLVSVKGKIVTLTFQGRYLASIDGNLLSNSKYSLECSFSLKAWDNPLSIVITLY